MVFCGSFLVSRKQSNHIRAICRAAGLSKGASTMKRCACQEKRCCRIANPQRSPVGVTVIPFGGASRHPRQKGKAFNGYDTAAYNYSKTVGEGCGRYTDVQHVLNPTL